GRERRNPGGRGDAQAMEAEPVGAQPRAGDEHRVHREHAGGEQLSAAGEHARESSGARPGQPPAIVRPMTPGRLIHETPRLRLRELDDEDAAFILELVNEPDWLPFNADPNRPSLDAARAYIARGPAASYAKNGFGLWAVELRATGERAGMCGLVRRASLPDVDLGFAFLARHRGRGYAREA